MTEVLPNFCVVTATGVNCDAETATGLRLAGGDAEVVHVSQLLEGDRSLSDYQGLVLPGGFSEGDAVRAGVLLGVQLQTGLGDQVRDFAESGKPVLGICNGFQVLVNMGLLPNGSIDAPQTASLTNNVTGRFACRWVDLAVNAAAATPLLSPYLGADGRSVTLPIANGEGRFRTDPATLARLRVQDEIVLRYANADGQPSLDIADNPSGADDAIAAIAVGAVMGMMPHPERFVQIEQHGNFRRPGFDIPPHGLTLLRGVVAYAASC